MAAKVHIRTVTQEVVALTLLVHLLAAAEAAMALVVAAEALGVAFIHLQLLKMAGHMVCLIGLTMYYLPVALRALQSPLVLVALQVLLPVQQAIRTTTMEPARRAAWQSIGKKATT